MRKPRNSHADRAVDLAMRTVLGLALALPYPTRVRLMGWLVAHVAAPLAGWRGRVRGNLALAMPELPRREVRRLERAVADNAGRALVELYSGVEFARHIARMPVVGAGLAAVEEARATGRPVLFVAAHFGNMHAPRAAMAARGHRIGGLYRPMRNPGVNKHYLRAMATLGEPLFPSTRRGMAGMVRHLREGGMLGILIDVHASDGAPLTFFGRTALTALSAAELALRHDALLLPVYGIRQPDGTSFVIRIDPPVTPGTPEAMTQALNDGLEEVIRAHPEQWFWIHRRWKPGGQRSRAAARIGP